MHFATCSHDKQLWHRTTYILSNAKYRRTYWYHSNLLLNCHSKLNAKWIRPTGIYELWTCPTSVPVILQQEFLTRGAGRGQKQCKNSTITQGNLLKPWRQLIYWHGEAFQLLATGGILLMGCWSVHQGVVTYWKFVTNHLWVGKITQFMASVKLGTRINWLHFEVERSRSQIDKNALLLWWHTDWWLAIF